MLIAGCIRAATGLRSEADPITLRPIFMLPLHLILDLPVRLALLNFLPELCTHYSSISHVLHALPITL
jgi:hypothetical protein